MIPASGWRWPNFTLQETACACCGEMCIIPASMDALQRLRNAWGKPIRLTSAHRCTRHNAAVGGAKASQHLGLAFDCACPASEQQAFVRAAKAAGFRGIIRYPSRGFVHLDCRATPYEAVAP